MPSDKGSTEHGEKHQIPYVFQKYSGKNLLINLVWGGRGEELR